MEQNKADDLMDQAIKRLAEKWLDCKFLLGFQEKGIAVEKEIKHEKGDCNGKQRI